MKRIACIGLTLLLALFSVPSLAKTLKLATIAPEGSSWMREMRAGAAEIKERTQGRVKIKFRTGGVMGNDRSVLRKIRLGQLDGGAFVFGSLAEVQPDLRIYGLPLLFVSQEEVDRVRTELDPALMRGLEEKGFVCFGFAGGGFARFLSNKPIASIEDARGEKMWVPEGDPVSYAGMGALGLSPVTLPMTDVLTGLQTGLVNIVATSPVGAIAFQWHTKVKYMTTTPLAYVPATLIVHDKPFKKLSAADQGVVREVMGRIYEKIDQDNRAENRNAYEALLNQGIQPVSPSPEELAKWRAHAMEINDKLAAEGKFSAELFEKLKSLLAAPVKAANP